MEASSSSPAPGAGSVAEVLRFLRLWCRRRARGLLRVEYTSELSRQRVVSTLRRDLAGEGVTLHEILLPEGLPPAQLVQHLLKRLNALPEGAAVCVSEFATALAPGAGNPAEGLYALNFQREQLTRPPLLQIWWMPPHIAQLLTSAVPDLDSWFRLRLQLTEIIPPVREERALEFSPRPKPPREEALAKAEELEKRFLTALEKGGESSERLIEELAYPAVELLVNADLHDEAANAARRFRERLQAAGCTDFGERLTVEAVLQRELERIESSLGPEYPKIAKHLRVLGSRLLDQARFSETEPLLRRALTLDEATHGPEHPDVAMDLNNLASLLQDTNRLTEAEALMRRALAMDEAAYGSEHPDVARDLNNLASLLKQTNRLAEAEPLMRRALAILEAAYGPEHPATLTVRDNLQRLVEAKNEA